MCPSGKRDSGGCIQREGTFTLSVVGEALRDQAFRCGTCSGRDVDKAAHMSIPLTTAEDFPTPCISGSRASFARKLQGGYKARDHVMYFGGVAKILGDASMRELYAMAGCSRLGIARE